VFVDAGTGITALANSLDIPADGLDFHVFLTHYHWDHLQGLPFFQPLYDDRNSFTFYGHSWEGKGVRALLGGALRPPWFPISIVDTAATKRYVDVDDGPFVLSGLTVSTVALRHPQGVTAYRFDHGGYSVVLATDYERGDPAADQALEELARDVDVLIHDAQYKPEEYPHSYIGWGHSTRAHAAEAAHQAGVRRLVLVSHEPGRADDEVDAIVAAARDEFPETEAAFEGMQIRF
jgi:phosphoribosyl 1,2-cyclic phosphodiesterase